MPKARSSRNGSSNKRTRRPEGAAAKPSSKRSSRPRGSSSKRPSDDASGSDSSRRPYWSGTITFGLVTLPVDVYPAVRSSGVSLRMVDDDGTPLRRRYYCPRDEIALDADDIVRGYPVGDDEFVTIEDAELDDMD